MITKEFVATESGISFQLFYCNISLAFTTNTGIFIRLYIITESIRY